MNLELTSFNNPFENLGDFSKNKLESLGMPNRKNEKWKYSELASYLQKFDLKDQKPSEVKYETHPDFTNLVFVNGELVHNQKGLIKRLDDSNKQTIDHIKEVNTKALADEWVMHLIEAHGENQYLLNLEKEQKIYIQHIYTQDFAEHTSYHLHINALKNSSTHILEIHHNYNENDASFTNSAHSYEVNENAQVHLTQLQNLNLKSSLINNIRAHVKRDGNFKHISINNGAKFSRNNLYSTVNAENAQTTLSGIYNLKENQHHDTNSYIGHNAPRTYSHQLYKGVMKDKSHGIFTGLIKVEKDAQEIESAQLNKNLLLSKGAHAHSRPQLEIFADDVKCAHGSTTGQMSEDELFYFNARGIPSDKARQILARAFSNDVLLKIENKDIRKICQKALIDKASI
jgi:Fe-S cluster assembly protein SufD